MNQGGSMDKNKEAWELSRIKAVMLGHAVADSLGVPVEFKSREELDRSPVLNMMGWGTYPVPEGSWSDDTSMSLAALDSLALGKIDYDEIMRGFDAWLSCGEYTPTGEVFDVGGTCRDAIHRYRSTGCDATAAGADTVYSNGNGSLMRIHPFALYLYYKGNADEAYMDVIHKASAMTHAHERSLIACGIYAFVLWELLDNPDKSSVIKGLGRALEYYKDRPEFSHYDGMLMTRIGRICEEPDNDGLVCDVSREEIKSSGYVVDTIEAAIWCLLTTNNYKSCVLNAVNLGEDTDTVGAIAGGLAGALYGLEDIPEEWLHTLRKREYIENMCKSAYDKWREVK